MYFIHLNMLLVGTVNLFSMHIIGLYAIQRVLWICLLRCPSSAKHNKIVTTQQNLHNAMKSQQGIGLISLCCANFVVFSMCWDMFLLCCGLFSMCCGTCGMFPFVLWLIFEVLQHVSVMLWLVFIVLQLGLHDIGKNSHCDILFFCNIYCDMKKKKKSPDDFNLYL